MKKILFYLTLLSCCTLSSCGDNEVYTWDFANHSITFHIVNANGENVLNSNVEGNILGNDIKAVYKDETFLLKNNDEEGEVQATTRYLPPRWQGLYIEDVEWQGPCLKFGQFSPTDNYRGETFKLDLGDGKAIEVRFDLWVEGGTAKDDWAKVHTALYVDGVQQEFPTAEIRWERE